MPAETMLEVNNLNVVFRARGGYLTASDNVSLKLAKGEWLTVMGPSGSGKSVLARSLCGILAGQPGIIGGEIVYGGNNLLEGVKESGRIVRDNGAITRVERNHHDWIKRYRKNYRKYAANRFSYIFQNPFDGLNPYFPVRRHLREAFRAGNEESGAIERKCIEVLDQLEIASPRTTLRLYPHELSGGMAQRVVIAMALAQRTSIIIADECTTSLDPVSAVSTVEALQGARNASGCSILFITHDAGMADTYSDRIVRCSQGRFTGEGVS